MPTSYEQARRPFDVVIDHEREIIRIQGVNYSFDFFDDLGFSSKGTRFQIGERQDGTVTLYAVPEAD